ncbi:MAG TPA: hypothetical protein VIL51_12690 [Thermoleophilia bacterium]
MALSKDASAGDLCCEICGSDLAGEIVLQQFADGSQARICRECAAGAHEVASFDFGASPPSPGSVRSPDSRASGGGVFASGDAADRDLTEELLMPVTDLIALQKDVQSALERLASSLERFAADVLVQSSDETAKVESRLQTLERELEQTRKRLQDTEGLLVPTGAPPAVAAPPVNLPGTEQAPATAGATAFPPSAATTAPAQAPIVAPPPPEEPSHAFTLEAVQVTQRYFNDSQFVEKIRGVRRSLGKPRANLSRVAGPGLRVFVTVTWDIVWYQFVVDLGRDVPQDQRVSLFREGMDLGELADHFKESNAIVDEDGRVDASELEVAHLSDASALITDMTPDEERALEDATEEIWDQHTSPEFKWDD